MKLKPTKEWAVVDRNHGKLFHISFSRSRARRVACILGPHFGVDRVLISKIKTKKKISEPTLEEELMSQHPDIPRY